MKSTLTSLIFILLSLLIVNESGAQSQQFKEYKDLFRSTFEPLSKAFKYLPQYQNSNRSADLQLNADTIKNYYLDELDAVFAYTYSDAPLPGEKSVPVVIEFTYPQNNASGNTNISYDNKGRISKFSGNLSSGGTEQAFQQEFIYDENDILRSISLEGDLFGVGISIRLFDSIFIANDDQGITRAYYHLTGIIGGPFNDLYINSALNNIQYNNNNEPTYFEYITFAENGEGELDTLVTVYNDVLWYAYDNHIFEFFKFESEQIIPIPEDLKYISNNDDISPLRILSMESLEFHPDGEIYYDEIKLISQTNERIEIQVTDNESEIYHFDNEKNIIKIEYQDLESEIVYNYIEYDYNEYNQLLSWRLYQHNEGRYELVEEETHEIVIDENGRLSSISLYDGEELFEFIYVTTSTKEKTNINSEISIFPNPATEFLQLAIGSDIMIDNSSYSVIDINGQSVVRNQRFNTSNSSIDISFLAPGVYILQWQNANQIANIKFSKI